MTNQLFSWPSVRPDRLAARPPSFEELEREARESARAEGLAIGRKLAEAELNSRISELQTLRQSLEQFRSLIAEQHIAEIGEFIRGAFSALLDMTLRIDPESFRSMMKQAVDTFPAGAKLSIRAHPDLAASLSRMLDSDIVEDVSLPRFSVQVDSDRGGWSTDLLKEFTCLLEQGMSIEH